MTPLRRVGHKLETFVGAMRKQLRANDHKGNWSDLVVTDDGTNTGPFVTGGPKPAMPEDHLVPPQEAALVMLHDLVYHAAKLGWAVVEDHPQAAAEFAADVANEAMIVLDLLGHMDPMYWGPEVPATMVSDLVELPSESYAGGDIKKALIEVTDAFMAGVGAVYHQSAHGPSRAAGRRADTKPGTRQVLVPKHKRERKTPESWFEGQSAGMVVGDDSIPF